MVELSWSGQRVPAIADELRCSPKTVRCRLHRFNRAGLDGLDDLGDRATSVGSPRPSLQGSLAWSGSRPRPRPRAGDGAGGQRAGCG
ncbi:helix-turn-helix domain-containing protein [Streptomyces sp. NPDC093094]|uniref:helix-turn-helix domain-containing protein n=1 Tax=Streptomyces sp. NPDC093094 TaxID=3366026 RepID=UPI0037F2B529